MKRLAITIALALTTLGLSAQSDDFGIWASASVEKKIDKRWSATLEAEYRTRDGLSNTDRWSFGLTTAYRPVKHLKLAAGYTLLWDHNPEKLTYNSYDPIEYNNRRLAYRGARHRFNVDATYDIDLGRFNLSLRERWQYTYRPEKTVTRYDYDNSKWEDTTVRGKAKNTLRSRLQLQYNAPGRIDPYASLELYNSWAVEKLRYTLGAEWRISKHHTLDLYYRYQDVRTTDTDTSDADIHVLGVGYKFKF